MVACNTSTAVALARPAPPLRPAGTRRDPARRVGGGPVDPQAAGRGDRHAGDDPLPRLFRGDQGREPGRRGLRARDAGARARWSRPASWPGRWPRRPCAEALAPLLGERDARRRVDLPAAARRDDRHAPPRLHPLPAAAAAHRGGRRARASRSSTRPRRPPPRWPSCSASTASRRHPTRRAGDAPPADDRRPARFGELAGRLFGATSRTSPRSTSRWPPDDGRERVAGRPGATTASGRPGS